MSGSHAPRPKKNRDTVHNEAWLRARYLDDRMSTTEIARLTDCSVPSVLWAMRKFGIQPRSMSEAKKGHHSTTVWTPEMREAMAAKRRGELNPMFGTVSPWAGRHKPEDQTTRHYGRGRARAIHPAKPCEVCGATKAERHHRNGNATDNSAENIAFYCRYHHLHEGHGGHWGNLNLPPGMSDERPAGPPLIHKPPMSSEQRAALSAHQSTVAKRWMTPERASAMARKSLEANPMTPDRARRMSLAGAEARQTPEARARRAASIKAAWARRKAQE